jgi:ribosomal protein S8E
MGRQQIKAHGGKRKGFRKKKRFYRQVQKLISEHKKKAVPCLDFLIIPNRLIDYKE